MTPQPPSRLRFPAMLLAMIALLAALWYGFVRLGWRVAIPRPEMLVAHGPLMVSGFLGTLIGVERAVALRQRLAYLPALLTGLGALALLAGLPFPVSRALIALGSLGLTIVFVVIVRRVPALYTGTMAAGVVAWLVGNVLWLAGFPNYQAVVWWIGFLVLTIAGERLELSRVLKLSRRSQIAFLAVNLIFLIGSILSLFLFDAGSRVAGVGLAAMGGWLLYNDVAVRTLRQTGLTRFIAVCLTAGYVWLMFGGLLLAALGGQTSGLKYDAILHSVFLGFVFAVIFGHAPLIFPSILGTAFSYHPRFYAHLVLLQASLFLRVTGDLAAWPPGRLWGGLLNALTLLFFLGSTALAMRRTSRE